MLARRGVAAALGALVIVSGTGHALGASAPIAIPSLAIVEQADDAANVPAPDADRTSTATTDEILSRQGVQGFESLLAVAAFEIENPFPEPVNVEATRIAEAQVAATSTAVAAAAMTATAEAQQMAIDATATAAAHEAAAGATATAAARQAVQDATATAVAMELGYARATATAEARSERTAAVRATRAAGFPTPAPVAATAPARGRPGFAADRVSLVSIALLPVLGGALGIRVWQRHREPFVIKAKPVKG